MIDVKCKICGKEHSVNNNRKDTYITCSMKCFSIYRKSLVPKNCECTNCKTLFHMKESQVKRYNRNMGIFCSMKCSTEYKKAFYLGENNPNFRGAQYDLGYRINHYPLKGRMKEHHFVAFNYLKIEKLPKNYCIHHRDCNIYNNTPENLALLTNSDHRWLHKQFGNATLWAFMNNKVSLEELISWSNNPEKSKQLLTLSVLNQPGITKQDELLETPTPNLGQEDNQQPSLDSNVFEGSTTNSQIPPSNVEDSNADTSVLPFKTDSNGFVKSIMPDGMIVDWVP